MVAGILFAFATSGPAGAVPGPVTEADRAEVLVGEVVVKALPDDRIAVVLDLFDGRGPDETTERVYILQTQSSSPPELPIHMPAAQLVFKKDRLLVLSLQEPRAVALFLSHVDPTEVESSIEESLEPRPGPAADVLLVSGYGLASHRGRFPRVIESWPPAPPEGWVQHQDSDGGVEEQNLCHAGGVGATDCSIECVVGACSVGCGPGYYACCKCGWTPSCICVDEGGGGSGECPPFPCVE